MTDELKPCPFCGKSELHIEKSIDVIYCKTCGAEMDMERGDWNTRPIEDALQSQLAARDALIERLVEAGEKACRDYEGFGYGIDNLFLKDSYIKPKSLPLEFSQDEFEDIVDEWQAMKGGEG